MAGRGSKAGARHIAPLIRGSFMQAIEQLKKAGTITSMADIWQEIIADDPARALELLSKYVPKEMLIEVDDARPFAFLGRPLTADEWSKLHGRAIIEHDPDTTGQEKLQ
jgi:hypothetical protein